MAFEVVAVLCAGLFAGAAIYITLVEHPARLECGTEVAATEFPPSYRRASVMQASLAVTGFLAALIAWLQGAGPLVLLGGILLGLVVPFTLLVVRPTNARLLDPSLSHGSGRSADAARALGKAARSQESQQHGCLLGTAGRFDELVIGVRAVRQRPTTWCVEASVGKVLNFA